MESSLLNKQRTIRTSSNILQIVQLSRNISMDNEQYIPGTTIWRSIGELYGWLCDTSKEHRRTQRKNNLIPQNCRETQSMFQMIKIQF